MEFNGFHFNGGSGLDMFLQVSQDPDAPIRVKLTLLINGELFRSGLTTFAESVSLTPIWARERIMEMIPVADKMNLFFKPEMRAYQDGKINAAATMNYIIEKMKTWSKDEREPIEQELNRIFYDSQ